MKYIKAVLEEVICIENVKLLKNVSAGESLRTQNPRGLLRYFLCYKVVGWEACFGIFSSEADVRLLRFSKEALL